MAQPASLDGRTALVTGAARRIGAEIATRLHEAGASVALHYRASADDAERLTEQLERLRPGSARSFAADLNDPQALTALVDSVVDWAGALHILVNNASAFYPTPLGTITLEQWDDLVGVNLRAPLFLSQAALPQLRANAGSIVNIVDIHARRPLRNHPVYGAAKAGLEMLTRSLAKEMAPEVRVNGVAPGAILWPENGMSESTRQSILSQVPLARQGGPRDIADCVLYLVRDAGYVTGQIIAVDGGRSLGW